MTRRPSLWYLTPLLVMSAIYYSSSQPGSAQTVASIPLGPGWLHNLLHVPAYALLAASWDLALPQRRRWRGAILIFALTLGYGIFDEWHQSFVPGRESSAADLLRDAVGAGLGLWLSNRVMLSRRRLSTRGQRTLGK